MVFPRAGGPNEPLKRGRGIGADGMVVDDDLLSVELLRLSDLFAAKHQRLEAFALGAEPLVADHRELDASRLGKHSSAKLFGE